MPDIHLYALFVAAVTLLMLLPGPNVGLIIANTIRHGTIFGMVTLAGTSAAMAVQLGVVALGLAAVLGQFGVWFGWVRWIGVGYLLYLGIAAWRAPPLAGGNAPVAPTSRRALFLRGFMVSLTNPKTLFFYGALLPQFISHNGHVGAQMAVLAATCVVIALVIDSGWCLLANHLRVRIAGRWVNRIGGSVLIGAGLGMALARGTRP